MVVPGTRLALAGQAFVPAEWGASRLRLRGAVDGRALDVELDAAFASYDRLEVALAPDAFARLGGEGVFAGDAIVEVDSAVDGATHASGSRRLDLEIRRALTPSVAAVDRGTLIYVNQAIGVAGTGFLLGGDEGETRAVVEGCVARSGGACAPIEPAEVVLEPVGPLDRTRASFRFAPEIAGVRPGAFVGPVRIANHPADGPSIASDPTPVDYELAAPIVFALGPAAAGLGQYVDVEGGGFVGDPAPDDDRPIEGSTTIELAGRFEPDGGGAVLPIDLVLVPRFVGGERVRYVLAEDDELGRAIDLRTSTGRFRGTARPIVRWRDDVVVGDAVAVELVVAPVKQVVHVVYRPTYVESLRRFGARALDARIRARVAEIVARDYRTINLELRADPPTDFAVYAEVEVGGPDVNGQGLLGYDNSPGKDTDNLRLYDRLGGVNAVTQADGYPGYGGVFVEALFAFSRHPDGLAASIPGQASPLFDAIFDPFRPDRGGTPVALADLAEPPPAVTGADCPAADRPTQIACAVYVLGNLIGTTMSHELGHSLGLANPYGDGFHDPSDVPDRLMDAGGARPFAERAELDGRGPARFCDDEYAYLRRILPTTGPDDPTPRPGCD
jgi:hypothetical protein